MYIVVKMHVITLLINFPLSLSKFRLAFFVHANSIFVCLKIKINLLFVPLCEKRGKLSYFTSINKPLSSCLSHHKESFIILWLMTRVKHFRVKNSHFHLLWNWIIRKSDFLTHTLYTIKIQIATKCLNM